MTDELLPKWMMRVEEKVDRVLELANRHDESLKAGARRFADQEDRIRELESGVVLQPACDARHAAPVEASALRRDLVRTGASVAQWLTALAALGLAAHAAGLF
jgi:hypothetical protein